jgi:hypothetical protein
MGLAALHSIDFAARSTVAHADVAPGQFVNVGGQYKVADLNMAQLIYRNKTETRRNCPFHQLFELGVPGTFRSPEEYYVDNHQFNPLTEKIDVYAFGNILHTLLHGESPFWGWDEARAVAQLRRRIPPSMSQEVLNSTDPAIVALRRLSLRCYAANPGDRPTMQEVVRELIDSLEVIDQKGPSSKRGPSFQQHVSASRSPRRIEPFLL